MRQSIQGAVGVWWAILFSALAAAQGGAPEKGSLLVFPEFDSRPGTVTLFTVANLNRNPVTGPVRLRYVYLQRFDKDGVNASCTPFTRQEDLTPNDALTVTTAAHFPGLGRGYAYVYAVEPGSTEPIEHDHLIGSQMVIDGFDGLAYGVNAFTFQAMTNGETDLDGDGRLDLDGMEYSRAPNDLVVPRFFGQDEDRISELILIDLGGGPGFTTSATVYIFNDNEELFSKEFAFSCWAKAPLAFISDVFTNDFLSTLTGHDPLEPLGAPLIETGFFRLRGIVSSTDTVTIPDPALLAVLIEKVGSVQSATLPFADGTQTASGLSQE